MARLRAAMAARGDRLSLSLLAGETPVEVEVVRKWLDFDVQGGAFPRVDLCLRPGMAVDDVPLVKTLHEIYPALGAAIYEAALSAAVGRCDAALLEVILRLNQAVLVHSGVETWQTRHAEDVARVHRPEAGNVIRLLLAHGLDPNLRSNAGGAPVGQPPTAEPILLTLAGNHRFEAVRVLLEAGADPTLCATGYYAGRNVLHRANTLAMAELLVEAIKRKDHDLAAMLRQTDVDGDDPTNFQHSNGRNAVCAYLKSLMPAA